MQIVRRKEMKMIADWFLVSEGATDCIWACHVCVNRCVAISVHKPKKCWKQEDKKDENSRLESGGH